MKKETDKPRPVPPQENTDRPARPSQDGLNPLPPREEPLAIERRLKGKNQRGHESDAGQSD